VRVTDPVGGPPDLEAYFRDYEKHFSGLKHYSGHLRRLVAGYSRGDGPDELRRAFAVVVQRVAAMQDELRAEGGRETRVFAHEGTYAGLFRDALVLLSFGLCLRGTRQDISVLLDNCERGDPLIETLAAAAAPDLAHAVTEPVFYSFFDRLYDAAMRRDVQREQCIADYLSGWYDDKMEGFAFKDAHLNEDASSYVGYWCFEAAGVVAALAIDDRRFASHPHYPKDLVGFFVATIP
jgi:hypothetical protein